ncbi:unnamed protein product [Thelazia callipaeda]|uniref:C3H1-type domain-containing protein n=1 Tax=Thelazia callipaeda TaxID=103827 RepID=A0A0N5CW75_THECL|nr:unnamed protein product [Thelazia callipaeda]
MNDQAEEQKILKAMKLDASHYNREHYIAQWHMYIYQSQLLLAQRKQKRKAETHKTVPCQAWKDTGRCNYGKRCKFAHGIEELRPVPKTEVKIFNNPRYRTALCIKYTTFGYCPYGDQCHFIHDPIKIDLEKCLDRLSPSSLQPSTNTKVDLLLDGPSHLGVEPESQHLTEWRKKNKLELITESDLNLDSEGLKPESAPVSQPLNFKESDNKGIATSCDPFRTDDLCKNEIELKPFKFNVFDDFIYVINPQFASKNQ